MEEKPIMSGMSDNTELVSNKANESTRPIPVKHSDKASTPKGGFEEKTQPITASSPPSILNPEAEIPDWLIAFASQPETDLSSQNKLEDTQQIKVKPESDLAHPEEVTQPVQVLPQTGSTSIWTAESVLESLSPETKVPTPHSEQSEENQIEKATFLAAFTNAIDTHNYDEAYQLLQDQALFPDQQKEAIKALRSRLTMLPENAPVWEIYAFLNAKENEPLLADKAQQTANLLKNLSEE